MFDLPAHGAESLGDTVPSRNERARERRCGTRSRDLSGTGSRGVSEEGSVEDAVGFGDCGVTMETSVPGTCVHSALSDRAALDRGRNGSPVWASPKRALVIVVPAPTSERNHQDRPTVRVQPLHTRSPPR